MARIAAQLTRRRPSPPAPVRLAVRAARATDADQVVVAFPWRRRGAAEALGRETRPGMEAIVRRSLDRWSPRRPPASRRSSPATSPTVPDPDDPRRPVTGTNGKTTTVRLLAHLVRSAERTVAYSSTDGVYRDDGELVEAGDYAGFGGAALALAQQPDVAVLETARGGMLLRGIGVSGTTTWRS